MENGADEEERTDCACCGTDGCGEDESPVRERIRLAAAAVLYAAGIAAVSLHAGRWVTLPLFVGSLVAAGGDVYLRAFRNILRGKVFDENLLMTIASISAFAIGQYEEGVAVMLFYQVGEFLQGLATRRSRRSIVELMDLRPDTARVRTESGVRTVPPEQVAVGAIIELRPGDKVPLDGEILEGRSLMDTSGLTGEPVPREVGPGDRVTGGFVNTDGLLAVRVDRPFGESTVAKIIELIEHAGGKKARAENFITKFARVYTPLVTAAALLLALVPPLLFSQPFYPWLYRGIVFLVVSCPCALVVSVPLGFFTGIGAASFNGVLVKGGNYLERLGEMDTIVFDKTGTLTRGVFEVERLRPAPAVSPEQLLAAASFAESFSHHPIARSIRAACGFPADGENAGMRGTEVPGMGVIAESSGRVVAAGNARLMEREHIPFDDCKEGGTVVYVAENGRYLGAVVIDDRIKEDAAGALDALRALGIRRIAMLTGDRERAARTVAARLHIDEVHAGLLPDRKVAEFERIAAASEGATAFVGDGINDAPVLAGADIGIAMGGAGSDAAVEAADVVIMNDQPGKLATAVRIARYVRAIVRQNIVLALGVKLMVLLLGALGLAGIWEAVFADTGVTVLAVFNSMRVLLRRRRFASGGMAR